MTPFIPMYVDTGTVHRPSLRPAGCPSLDHRRVQDDDRWFASVDQGLCLSISQPYASLLVAGIKRHEGRNWYTSHRGPLWIASTPRNVDANVIEEMENVYRHLRGDSVGLQFPTRYRTGALLGRVNVIDCLPQEQYREKFPDGEIEDSFVLICDHFATLPVPYMINSQQHKIYKIDSNIHHAAMKMLK